MQDLRPSVPLRGTEMCSLMITSMAVIKAYLSSHQSVSNEHKTDRPQHPTKNSDREQSLYMFQSRLKTILFLKVIVVYLYHSVFDSH